MTVNIKRPPEKDMPVFLEVKGLEAICIEGTIFEVMGKMILKEKGKMIFEVMCHVLVDIEGTILEAKSKMILEETRPLEANSEEMDLKDKGCLKNAEETRTTKSCLGGEKAEEKRKKVYSGQVVVKLSTGQLVVQETLRGVTLTIVSSKMPEPVC